jgi:hypothetical protein
MIHGSAKVISRSEEQAKIDSRRLEPENREKGNLFFSYTLS